MPRKFSKFAQLRKILEKLRMLEMRNFAQLRAQVRAQVRPGRSKGPSREFATDETPMKTTVTDGRGSAWKPILPVRVLEPGRRTQNDGGFAGRNAQLRQFGIDLRVQVFTLQDGNSQGAMFLHPDLDGFCFALASWRGRVCRCSQQRFEPADRPALFSEPVSCVLQPPFQQGDALGAQTKRLVHQLIDVHGGDRVD